MSGKYTALAVLSASLGLTAAAQVTVTPHEADRRIDVTIDGHPFTSYMWPTSLDKPVLYPLIAPDGTTVTRGFPLEPRQGERVDHPHHAGVWFNYGNVNGFDFWNNSGAIPAAQKPKMGSIHHTRVVSTKSGKHEGEIVTESTWTDSTGVDQMKELTRYIFRDENGMRSIDRIATLTALKPVTFHDDKEGLLGIRIAHFLESATEKGGVFNDASGRPTKVAEGDNTGATGVYRTSAGVTGDKVWSTRGAWCSLTGTSPEGKTETVVILDNPANPGFPSYWHARGYGLFAANPLGDHIFDPKAPEHNFTIAQGQSATFRYRILLNSSAMTPQQVDAAEAAFAKVK
ncbi:PmoA family protein [Terriglobus roseus]|uniref:Methane oxygenase PmoA n=1 Tax=Terriglobus roseus TaxID=392734 RepID=A0A1H4JRM4_9BACT|nr:PmoA family protein [Terriglobus roseus]SEB48939.1 Methane oxygenase PmoA [Terriglobus roseus]